MKILSITASAICLMSYSTVLAQDGSPKMRVGVIEFKVENDVGIENGGRIVAEWVASEIVRVGRFDVSERLSMEAILAEQDLGLAGILSDETAAEIGKIHGVQGIVTGSIMKIGSTISVTGRIIAVESGEVLKTSVVRASSLDDLPHEIEVLANALSEVSRAQFEIQQDLSKRSQTLMAVGAGFSAGSSTTDGWSGESGGGLAVFASVSNQTGSVWLNGVPLGSMRHLSFGALYNITPFWGPVVEYGFMSDEAIDEVSSYYLILGLGFQPRHEISGKIFVVGGTTKGQIWMWDEPEDVEGHFQGMPPASFGAEFTFRLKGNNTIGARYIVATLSDYTLKNHTDPFGNFYQVGLLTLNWQREFAIGL